MPSTTTFLPLLFASPLLASPLLTTSTTTVATTTTTLHVSATPDPLLDRSEQKHPYPWHLDKFQNSLVGMVTNPVEPGEKRSAPPQDETTVADSTTVATTTTTLSVSSSPAASSPAVTPAPSHQVQERGAAVTTMFFPPNAVGKDSKDPAKDLLAWCDNLARGGVQLAECIELVHYHGLGDVKPDNWYNRKHLPAMGDTWKEKGVGYVLLNAIPVTVTVAPPKKPSFKDELNKFVGDAGNELEDLFHGKISKRDFPHKLSNDQLRELVDSLNHPPPYPWNLRKDEAEVARWLAAATATASPKEMDVASETAIAAATPGMEGRAMTLYIQGSPTVLGAKVTTMVTRVRG